jgi:hypothetical protein
VETSRWDVRSIDTEDRKIREYAGSREHRPISHNGNQFDQKRRRQSRKRGK